MTRVTIHDLRAARYCLAGVRPWFRRHGLGWQEFLDHGIDADRLRATGDYEAAHKAFIARQPMGRIGRSEEIAALAVYLGSDDAAFTTGQAHVIDGGWAMA